MIPMSHGLFIAAALFAIGLLGVLRRRNLLFVLLSVEMMLNAAGFAFIVASHIAGNVEGQIMFIFILAVAASEVAIALALVMKLEGRFKTLHIDAMHNLKG